MMNLQKVIPILRFLFLSNKFFSILNFTVYETKFLGSIAHFKNNFNTSSKF